MSTRPRKPQYFPRMKVRGARRRQLAPSQRLARAFVLFGEAMQDFTRLMEAAWKDFRPRHMLGTPTNGKCEPPNGYPKLTALAEAELNRIDGEQQ